MKRCALRFCLLLLLVSPPLREGLVCAQDIPLTKILASGDEWKAVPTRQFQSIGGLATDGRGLVYVSDPQSKQILRVDLEGSVNLFATLTEGVTGLAFDEQGQLYGCQPGKGRIVRIEGPDRETIVAESLKGIQNLVITREGNIYCTVPPEQAIYLIRNEGEKREVDRGIAAPTGLVLWPDQGSLVVADSEGSHLWAFRITREGTLADKDRYYALRVRKMQPSGAEGLTVDSGGLIYATSQAGVQVFDPTGRLCGVLLRPSTEQQVALTFAGPQRDQLLLACKNKLYSRKMLTRGIK